MGDHFGSVINNELILLEENNFITLVFLGT